MCDLTNIEKRKLDKLLEMGGGYVLGGMGGHDTYLRYLVYAPDGSGPFEGQCYQSKLSSSCLRSVTIFSRGLASVALTPDSSSSPVLGQTLPSQEGVLYVFVGE
jgi:hypothetical protein